MMKIKKEMPIKEVIKDYPRSARVFRKYNMGCIECSGAEMESVEKGAIMHGLDANELLEELNSAIL